MSKSFILEADMISPTTSTTEMLVEDLYTYFNYEELKQKCEQSGGCLKESKDFYEYRILETLKRISKGKTVEEIHMLLG